MDIITQHLAADIDSKLCLPLLYKTFLTVTVTSDECVSVLKECVLVVCVMIRDNDTVLHMPRYTSTINCGYSVASPQTSCPICKSMPLKIYLQHVGEVSVQPLQSSSLQFRLVESCVEQSLK